MKGIKKASPHWWSTSLKGLQRSRQQLPGGRFRQRRQRHGARRQRFAAAEAAEEHRPGALQVLGKCWENDGKPMINHHFWVIFRFFSLDSPFSFFSLGFSFFSFFFHRPLQEVSHRLKENHRIGLRLYLQETPEYIEWKKNSWFPVMIFLKPI
jgi:hypothetical protein